MDNTQIDHNELVTEVTAELLDVPMATKADKITAKVYELLGPEVDVIVTHPKPRRWYVEIRKGSKYQKFLVFNSTKDSQLEDLILRVGNMIRSGKPSGCKTCGGKISGL